MFLVFFSNNLEEFNIYYELMTPQHMTMDTKYICLDGVLRPSLEFSSIWRLTIVSQELQI